ncbi:MAG: ABC transporter permease [Coriobacteriales bacterium]|jgi:putative spermidine/putrescine transport system permease protein
MARARRRKALPTAFLALHIVIVAIPISVLVIWSFTAYWPWPDLLPQTLSLKGFEDLFSPGTHLGFILAQSIGIAVACALITTAIAAMAARALARYRFVGHDVFHFFTVLPFLVPSTVFAMGIQVAFIRAGLARTVTGVILAHSIVALPYAVTIMIDVSVAAGGKLEEAARALGASPWQNLVHVIIPGIAPGLLTSFSMSYILSFSQYFLTLLIGGGAVKTFALTMFPYLTGSDRTVASAYGIVFLVSTFVVFLILELVLKKFGYRTRQNLYGA